MSRILTGLRANNGMHLGNYLGGILPMVKFANNLTNQDELFMFVPDLHSFTTPIDHQKLYQNSLDNIKTYIAAGINTSNPNILLYRQSRVRGHTELAWILACFCYMGEASRMTQFKEKSGGKSSSVSVGLFTYPILMAADILLYQAPWVPVGEDQFQHLELARDLAIRMNNKFEKNTQKPLFEVPKTPQEQLKFMNLDEGIRIRSLSNPTKKMSKSEDDLKGKIDLTDKPEIAVKKIMSATTDSLECISFDWQNQPGITNLLQLAYLLSGKSKAEIISLYEGQNQYGPLKKYVADLVYTFLSNYQQKVALISDKEVEDLLFINEEKANIEAQKTLKIVQKAVGLY